MPTAWCRLFCLQSSSWKKQRYLQEGESLKNLLDVSSLSNCSVQTNMYSPPPRLKPVDITKQAGIPVYCAADEKVGLALQPVSRYNRIQWHYNAYFQTLFSSKVYFLSGNLGKLILSLSGVGWWLLLLLNHQKNWLATSSGWQPLLQYYRLARNLGRGPPPCASTSGATFKRGADHSFLSFPLAGVQDGGPTGGCEVSALKRRKTWKKKSEDEFLQFGEGFYYCPDIRLAGMAHFGHQG